MTDPIAGLEHDHVAFSEVVAQVKAILASRLPADVERDLRTHRLVEGLRDDLVAHFAKEEEGLFPFVASTLPEVAGEVDRLLSGHETVCGCIVRLAHRLGTSRGCDEAANALFERFERVYTEHARSEVQLLHKVGGRLGPGERRVLDALLEGL